MKKILFGIGVCLLMGCNQQTVLQKVEPVIGKSDSMIVLVDSLKTANKKLVDRNDSLGIQLILADLKIEKAKYYLKIVNKKPDQIKFLKGWLNRTFE